MEEELDEINNSLQNNKEGSISSPIESDARLLTGNQAPTLFKIVKELYKLANKAITPSNQMMSLSKVPLQWIW